MKLEPDRVSEEKLRIDGLDKLLNLGREARVLGDGVKGYTENHRD